MTSDETGKPIELLQGFMALTNGCERRHSAMAACAILIMLAHEEGHDADTLISWFARRVGHSWHVFRREIIEDAFNDPRMPKQQ